MTAGHPEFTSMGSIYSRLRGAYNAQTGLPTYSLVSTDEVDGQYRNEKGRVERGSRPGALGAAFAPFNPGGKGTATEKIAAMEEAGIVVAASPADMGGAVERALQQAG